MIPLATDITAEEADAMTVAARLVKGKQLSLRVRQALARHIQPLEEAARRRHLDATARYTIRRAIEMAGVVDPAAPWPPQALPMQFGTRRPGWPQGAWQDLTSRQSLTSPTASVASGRWKILAAGVKPTNFARRLFGTEAVAQEQQRVIDYLCSIGYRHDESMFHGVRTLDVRAD
jgi:hypothetical protein